MVAAVEEHFEVFDRTGRSIGLEARSAVHRTGAWHRSSQVFVFDDRDRLLVQQRVAHKDLYGGLWDYSVGEHLKPGEDHAAGALRGLKEELGIEGVEVSPLGPEYNMEIRQTTFWDREIQQAFRTLYCGDLHLDPAEVQQVMHVPLDRLTRWIDTRPQDFTPWFRASLLKFDLLR